MNDKKPAKLVDDRCKKGLMALVVVLVYAADQLSKAVVERTMELGQRIEVIDGFFRWFYILNPGAAFSFGEGHTWVFTLIQSVAVLIVIVALVRSRALWWILSLATLLGGILGNLTDRLFRPPGFGTGHVVDFISVGNFAIFNIADAAICCAMVGVILLTLVGLKLDGSYETKAEKA
ncbi:signal peptidase II [Rothia sp. ZJ1223]|uniref:signal peptidase II n=1 Tax=Rothia sp. ZJ1223 TaxID=2811098 RepID=UPI00351C5D6C